METDNVMLKDMESTFKECLEVAKKKNADYAGAGNDPFRNFRNSSVVGVPPQQGVMVRLMDKMSRIGNLLTKEAEVKDEAVEDTIDDAINYLAILKSMRKNKIQ